MARKHTDRKEARRGREEDKRQTQRTEAREARRGERADYLHIRPGNADYAGPVKSDLARLQGRSRSEVASDKDRGSRSPLAEERRKRR
jgi:hypothetical protein